MTTPQRAYDVVAQLDDTDYNPATGVTQRGVRFTIHSFDPDVYFKVFLPAGYVNAANLEAAVAGEIAERRKIAALGAVATAPSK